MNIITIIQTALTALNSESELFLLERSRAENEELNHTSDVVIVLPDWRGQSQFTQALEITTRRTYNIHFKTLDEWDNSDNNIPTSYESETSVDKIERMETLANSVFYYIQKNSNLFPEIIKKLTWSIPRPILRANNGTMTGVEVQLNITFKGERNC
jgi:hypothetical protein